MSIKIINSDFEQAKAIIKDSIELSLFEENRKNDINKFKFIKARELNPEFEYEIALMICGDGDNSFPYRSSYFLTQFFQELGFNYSHDGTTRRFWVRDVLLQMSTEDIIKLIRKGLFNKRYFKKHAQDNTSYDHINKYQEAIEEFKTFIDECFELSKEIDLGVILETNVNTDLLFNADVKTSDDELNRLISDAKRRFVNSNDKYIALEKLWDAFERLKTYFGKNKKTSAEKLINVTSQELDRGYLDEEFSALTKIGNNYRIRHHETNKVKIENNNTLNYLFFRMLNLIEYCVDALNNKKIKS